MKTKKGELTSKQLITIIILIISFSIILIFFFMFDFKGTIDKETCRNSVVMRGRFSFLKMINPISLKCKTQDVCLSMGGNCETSAKDLEKIQVRDESELIKEIGGLIYDCWWMMGEGKVEYSSKGCAICSKIYFDEEIQKYYSNKEDGERNELNYIKIYNYLANKIPESDKTYLYEFYKINSISAVRNKIFEDHNLDINDEKIDVSEEYAIVDSYYGGYHPPILVKFSGEELNQRFKCTEYVTEI